MDSPLRSPRLKPALLALLSIVPAVFTGILIHKYAVDLPYTDELNLTVLFDKAARGVLTTQDLFAQQNEYRQFFPNLIIVALGRLTGWNVRYEMLVSFLLACLTSFNIYRLGRLTIFEGRARRLLLYLSANLLIFSPVQGENWLQGQQLIYFIPIACVTTSLLLARCARLDTNLKYLLCGALAVISSFSSANGLLCWVVALPPLALPAVKAERRREGLRVTGWLAGLALCATVYFYDYRQPPSHPSPVEALWHPARAALYLLALLGSPLAFSGVVIAICVGAALLLLFAWSCWRFYLSFVRAPGRAHSMLVWLMLGAYSLLTAALITAGRLEFGIGPALSPRYTTFTLYLPVALVHLLPLALSAGVVSPLPVKVSPARVVSLLASALLIIHLPIYLLGIRHMSVQRATLMQYKACALLANVVQDSCLTKIASDTDALRQQLNALDRLGYLRPELLKSARVPEFAAPDARPLDAYGSFPTLVRIDGGEYTAAGEARLPHRGEPADVVLLAYREPRGEPVVFAVADTEINRDFVSALLRRGKYGDASWHKTFSASALPRPPVELSAWAFDALTGRAYKLAGTHNIE